MPYVYSVTPQRVIRMNHPETISAGHLKAVSQILEEVAPDLSCHMKTILDQVQLPAWSGRGRSTAAGYPFNLLAADGGAILLALEDSRETHGPNQMFGGFSIPALIMTWRALLVGV